MGSWRIQTLIKNLSNSVALNPNTIGATTIRATRGTTQPIFLNKGEEKRALDLFGTPSATYTDLFEVIEFIKKYPCWVSAPNKNGKHGGILLTTGGSEALVSGFTPEQVAALVFTAIPVRETVGTGNAILTNFTKTVGDIDHYVHQSVDVIVNGVSMEIAASDAAPEVLTGTNIDTGSTFNRTTGLLTLNFVTPIPDGHVIETTYDIDRSADAYGVLLDKSPAADWFSVQIASDATDQFTISLYKKNVDGTYDEVNDSPYTIALTAGTVNGFGQNIYAGDVLADHDYLQIVLNADLAFSSFADDGAKVDFNGGTRGDAITITEINLGYAYFQSASTYAAKVFFDCTAIAGVQTTFNTMRTTYQKYARYLLPLPQQDVSTAIATKTGYSMNNDGLAFYWNYFKIQDTYNNTFAYSNLMGRVATKHADIIEFGFGGYSPSWIDENGMGGQLGSGIISAVYNPTETQLQSLDTAQINPIIFDSTNGVMILGDRTAVTSLSDYSYIPHVGLRDYLLENIEAQVLPRQLTKLNDDFHRSQVKQLVTSIVLTTTSLLEDFIVKCDRENNNDTVRQQRKFVLQVAVKYITFSQTINFEFINTPQGVTVSSVLS